MFKLKQKCANTPKLAIACFNLEAEAVLLTIKHIEAKEWKWISSEVVSFEIQQTPNADRRTEVQLLTDHADSSVMLNESLIQWGET